jgi:hypothetical protein
METAMMTRTLFGFAASLILSIGCADTPTTGTAAIDNELPPIAGECALSPGDLLDDRETPPTVSLPLGKQEVDAVEFLVSTDLDSDSRELFTQYAAAYHNLQVAPEVTEAQIDLVVSAESVLIGEAAPTRGLLSALALENERWVAQLGCAPEMGSTSDESPYMNPVVPKPSIQPDAPYSIGIIADQ